MKNIILLLITIVILVGCIQTPKEESKDIKAEVAGLPRELSLPNVSVPDVELKISALDNPFPETPTIK